MGLEQSIQEGLRAAERRLAAIRREDRADERKRFNHWSDRVLERAEAQGKKTPTSAELRMLKRLAEMESPFSASHVVRNGWCGIRSVADASNALERFVQSGWLHPALPNREGHPRYAFTREYSLGRDHLAERAWWPQWIEMWNVPDTRHTRGTGGKPGFNPLVAAGFVEGGTPDEYAEATGEEFVGPGFDYCEVPDPAAEGDLWAVAKVIAWDEGTGLHKIANTIDGLTPIQRAYAIAIAACRVTGDPIATHIRGVAEYLAVDYNALSAGVNAAEAAFRKLNEAETPKLDSAISDNSATPMPTIEL